MDYTNDKKTSDTEYQRDGAVEGGNVNTLRDDRREYSRGGRARGGGGAHQSDNWRSFPDSGNGESGDFRGGRYRGGRGGGRGGRGGGRGGRGSYNAWADREGNEEGNDAPSAAPEGTASAPRAAAAAGAPATAGSAEAPAQQQQEGRETASDRWGREDDRGYGRGGNYRGGGRGGFNSRGGRGGSRFYDAEDESSSRYVNNSNYNARRGEGENAEGGEGGEGGEEGGYGGGYRRGGRGGFNSRGGRGGRRFYDDEGGYGGGDAAEEGDRERDNDGGFRRGGRGGGRGGGRDFDYDRPRGGRGGGRGGRRDFRSFRDGDENAEGSGAAPAQENAWTASPEPASSTPAVEERPTAPREVPAPAPPPAPAAAPAPTAATLLAQRAPPKAEALSEWEEAAAPAQPAIRRVTRASHLRKNCHDEAKVMELFQHHHRQTGISLENYDSIPVEMVPRDIKPVDDFSDLLVEPALAENIERCGYKRPTPVQRYGIPVALAGNDLMACAQTGSGKTAAFLIPVVQHMLVHGVSPARNRKSYPVALVLAPTRELAVQIFDEVRKLTFNTDIFYDVVYGGTRYPNRFEQDILVACPGRLRDMFNEEYLSFAAIKFLILDEADRMLEMGFEEQIEELVASRYTDMPTVDDRQTFMFSATFPLRILNLAKRYLRRKYYLLTVGRVGSTTKNITQTIENVPDSEKMDRLVQIIYGHEMSDMVLVFVETKKMAEDVNRRLHREGIHSTTIHGDRRQQDREAALEDFKQKVTPILVATDVASRGLDIPDVAHVVQFDLPQELDDYTHRIGRTGRAGNKGIATSFYNRNNRRLAMDLHKYFSEHSQEIPKWFQQEAELVEGEALLSRETGGGGRRRGGGGGGGGGGRGGGGGGGGGGGRGGGGGGGGGGTWGEGRSTGPSMSTRRGGGLDDGGF